ncbi:hypothetical protein [Rhizobium sp. 21-4511-3d]
MRIKLIAASVVALAMATSVSYAQSNPVPNHMATDKNANEDAGGGAGSSDSSGTKIMKPMGTDSTMTNSTTEQTKCKDGSNAKGALQTQAGKGDATPQDQACGENNN